jgi:hypothetical protein
VNHELVQHQAQAKVQQPRDKVQYLYGQREEIEEIDSEEDFNELKEE